MVALMVALMVDFVGIEWVWLNAQNIPEFNGYNMIWPENGYLGELQGWFPSNSHPVTSEVIFFPARIYGKLMSGKPWDKDAWNHT